MEPKELREKLNGILQAIAAGRSCEEILAADRSLRYHDVFHAVAEAPTSFWKSAAASPARKGQPRPPASIRLPLRHRTD